MTEPPSRTPLGGALTRKKSHRRANKDEMRFVDGRFILEEVFDDTQMQDMLALAHSRIVGVFRRSTENVKRRATSSERQFEKSLGVSLTKRATVSTDNYIIGLSAKAADLSSYLSGSINNHFIRPASLPEQLNDLSYKLQVKIAKKIQTKLIAVELASMRNQAQIWYDEALGIWNIQQSVIDEHVSARKNRRAAAVKFDRRNEHGMVRAQRKNRNRPAGVSVSWQPAR